MNEISLPRLSDTGLLGISADKKLTSHNNISSLLSKVGRKVGVLTRIKSLLSLRAWKLYVSGIISLT